MRQGEGVVPVTRLREQAASCGHRLVVVFSGSASWCREQAQGLLDSLEEGLVLRVADPEQDATAIDWSRARGWLGRELDGLLVDAFAGFDADGFAALAGTLRAGGVLLLLVPPLQQWAHYPDPRHQRLAPWPYPASAVGGRFLRRFAACLVDQQGIWVVAEGEGEPDWRYRCDSRAVPIAVPPYAHAEQQAAVAAIHHVIHGHRNRPLVLTADRGRGKSAALGIAAAQLLGEGVATILLTGPSLEAVAKVFAHAAALLPESTLRRGELAWQGRTLRFIAPDALLHERPAARLLLVDEAAALPLPMLEGMLHHYARLVLASTVHGYEGSGRGFVLRFAARLDLLAPGWQALRIQQAVRWAVGDPLEALCLQGLLLDAEAVPAEKLAAAEAGGCECEWLDRDALLRDEAALRALFGLLQTAHYRTSPNDLRQLLDGPGMAIAVLRWRGQIVAAAVLGEEGGLTADLAEAVYRGERRLQGHLLPQSLAVHAGFVEAACLRAVRVIRLAVHPACQRRGMGRRLLAAVRQRYDGADYLGASFGASAGLLAFWQREGFVPLRLGLRREASSGAHAIMVAQPLSPAAGALLARIRARFVAQLPVLLREPLQQLEGELVCALLGNRRDSRASELEAQDWRDVESFAYAGRGYEVCMLALQRLVLGHGERLITLAPVPQQLVVQKVLQHQGWEQCASQAGLTGRAEALAMLRQAVAALLEVQE